MARPRRGADAFEFLWKCAGEHRQRDVDVIIICAPRQEALAEYVGQSVAEVWQEGLGAVEEGKLHMPEHLRAFVEIVNGRSPGGAPPEKVESFFAALPGDCDSCCSTRPSLEMAILEASCLLDDDLLNALAGLVGSDQVMVLPVLTNEYLAQDELLIRTAYLRLTVTCSASSRYLIPVYTEPLRAPNYLFRSVKGMTFYRVSTEGTLLPGIRPRSTECLQTGILRFFGKKINNRRCRPKSADRTGFVPRDPPEGTPAPTNEFLSEADLLVGTAFLKLAGPSGWTSRYLIPAYPQPLRVPECLFRNIQGTAFFHVGRWGAALPREPPRRTGLLQTTMLEFFVKKINSRRHMHKSGDCRRYGLESEGNTGGHPSG